MIRVEVESYCDDCLAFEPDVEQPQRSYADGMVFYQTDTVVRCKKRKHCARLVQYLRKQDEVHQNETEKET